MTSQHPFPCPTIPVSQSPRFCGSHYHPNRLFFLLIMVVSPFRSVSGEGSAPSSPPRVAMSSSRSPGFDDSIDDTSSADASPQGPYPPRPLSLFPLPSPSCLLLFSPRISSSFTFYSSLSLSLSLSLYLSISLSPPASKISTTTT